MKATSARLTVGSLREVSTVGVVATLAAAYGAVLICASDIMTVVAASNGGSAGMVLGTVATVFIMIALFVSAIVISGGVDTVIAGRRKQLRLLRLIGASGRQLSNSLTRAVAIVAAAGAAAGIVIGVTGTAIARIILVHNGTLPEGNYTMASPWVLVAGIAVVATAVAAARVGSRNTLRSAAATQQIRSKVSGLRTTIAILIIVAGAGLLALAAELGEQGSLAGFIFAFFGAATTSVGILLGARRIVPAMVALGGRFLGSSAPSIVARKNAVSDPQRTTRSVIGLFIGVTLVTTIATGMSSLTRAVNDWDLTADQAAETQGVLRAITAILLAMIAISVVIAAVGFVSTMSLTVIGRTREIGMLRAMGFTAPQVRSMIFREAIALSVTAVIGGLVLGTIFGTVGSQSLIGSTSAGIPLGLPWAAFLAIIVGTVILALASSLPPGRRAMSVAPVDALAVS